MKTATQQHADSRYASALDLDHSGPAPLHRADRIVIRACVAALIALAIILWTSDAAHAQQPPTSTTATTDASAAATTDATTLHIVAHGLSHHMAPRQNGREWNERNTGAGLRLSFSTTWGVQAGAYRNSIERTSRYLFAEYTPLQVSTPAGPVSAGVFAGVVDGYKANNGGWRPAGGLLGRWQPNAFSLTARVVPKGSVDGSPVVSVEAGWRF